jgi:hypothetical protein
MLLKICTSEYVVLDKIISIEVHHTDPVIIINLGPGVSSISIECDNEEDLKVKLDKLCRSMGVLEL